VLTEAAWLLRQRPNEVRELLRSCRTGLIQILPLKEKDTEGMDAILSKYHDQKFQLADVSLMTLAERESIEHIFTLDTRDFSIYRTTNGNALTLLPKRASSI
jgi:hypothetical protein